jgi:hypothetical protein
MLVRLMATMGLAGSRAEYSLAPARGMAGDVRGVGADGVGVVVGAMAARAGATVEATTADAGTTADADTHAGQPVAFMEAADFMAPRAEASTVAEGEASTAEAVGMAEADIGNPRLIRSTR